LRTETSKLTRPSARRRWAALLLTVVAGTLAGACRQDMHNQPKYKPFRESRFFADGEEMRQPIAGTVARGRSPQADPAFLREDDLYYTAFTPDGELVTTLPAPLTMSPELLLRGRQRFDVFCAPCHDQSGRGRGMIVQRGFKQPLTFHSERLRTMPIGYFYDVISNGFGQMSSYGAQVPPDDRWAIAAYIRALQVAQYAPADLLSAADQTAIATAQQPAAPAPIAAHGAAHP
jgi:mono/diheme cytochrome c family protein